MITRKKVNNNVGDKSRIKTDRPLCEKDEQAEAIEQMRKYQNQVLELWRSFIKTKTDAGTDYIES
jgi:hypothetical protein